MNADQLRAVCREMCEGVPRARPTHPQLLHDVRGAYFTAQKSETFRAIVADLAGRPSLAVVEVVNASRDAWKAYAEHVETCDYGLTLIDDRRWVCCAEGARLRGLAVQS